jgi:4-hydroxy-3-methylbut-2-enyl diphosphate reductase
MGEGLSQKCLTRKGISLEIAQPHGMCSGVDRALKIAHRIFDEHPGERLWCYHEIVHNQHVVAELKARGALFVDAIADIPMHGRVLFSAHGVAPHVWEEAHARHLEIVDATCPFVAKVHREARDFAQQALPMVLIGHKGHDEVVGVIGEAPEGIEVMESASDLAMIQARWPAAKALGLLSQTTISEEMLMACQAALVAAGYTLVYPQMKDICYATQERQKAVALLAQRVEVLLVLGSPNSSNSRRLVEVAEKEGCKAFLLDAPEAVDALDLTGYHRLGVTSGASSPEALFDQLVHRLIETC